MRMPLPEQQAVLDNTARVRVVRAAPGSGKTWLVAELIRRELDKWPTMTSGVAALSFTRVGGDEIRSAVGHDLDHPHYVGTLDAFLFRFVVRPFLHMCFPSIATPRLIPGEWGAENWVRYKQDQGASVGKGVNLFSCVFIGEDENGASVVAHKPHPAQPLCPLEGEALQSVKQAKMDCWKRSGAMTHSDAALWASKILTHKTFGTRIRDEIVHRFPLIIVDELQDTGYFLGKSIRCLLDGSKARGVLVGDPDQAIYEFNGARPDLFCTFESINGVARLSLSTSQRCPLTAATAASHLKDSGGVIGAALHKTGRSFLVRYTDMILDVQQIVRALREVRSSGVIKVIARQTSTVNALQGKNTKSSPKLGSPSLNHMQRAVVLFRQGRQVAALAAARAALNLAVFRYEGVEDAELENAGIDPGDWKILAIDCLIGANKETTEGSIFEWQIKIKHVLENRLLAYELPKQFKADIRVQGPQKRTDWEKSCAIYLPQDDQSRLVPIDVPVKTVHGVKGETHDVTIFVCPDTRDKRYCPSTVWWSEDERDREERRIAYVAMTRTQGDLILCVSDAIYQRLNESRGKFLESFECMTAAEFSTILASSIGAPTQALF